MGLLILYVFNGSASLIEKRLAERDAQVLASQVRSKIDDAFRQEIFALDLGREPMKLIQELVYSMSPFCSTFCSAFASPDSMGFPHCLPWVG